MWKSCASNVKRKTYTYQHSIPIKFQIDISFRDEFKWAVTKLVSYIVVIELNSLKCEIAPIWSLSEETRSNWTLWLFIRPGVRVNSVLRNAWLRAANDTHGRRWFNFKWIREIDASGLRTDWEIENELEFEPGTIESPSRILMPRSHRVGRGSSRAV